MILTRGKGHTINQEMFRVINLFLAIWLFVFNVKPFAYPLS